nr:InlB B-repeat-containing protein [uncultured Lachnoclostridium sp.]
MKNNKSKEGKITMKKIKSLLTRIACLTLAVLVASGSTLVYADNGSFSIGDQEIFDSLPDGTIVHADYATFVEEGTAYTTDKILKVLVRDSGVIGGMRNVFSGTEDFDDNIRVVTPIGNLAFTGDTETAKQQIPVSITYRGVNTYVLEDPVYVYYPAITNISMAYELAWHWVAGKTVDKDFIKNSVLHHITVYSPATIGEEREIYPTNPEWEDLVIDSVVFTGDSSDYFYSYKSYEITMSYRKTSTYNTFTRTLTVRQPAVVYDSNGATSGIVPIELSDAYKGSKIYVYGNTGNLEKDGRKFISWNTSPDGTGTDYYEAGRIISNNTSTILYAIYEEDTTTDPTPEPEVEYTVTYDTSAKGGLGTITDPTIYKAGDEVTILDCSSSAASGYEVEGIYENADYSGTNYSAGDTFTIASDKPFYVRYVAIGYHLSFNKNGGNGTLAEDTTVYNSGDIAVLPSLSSLTRAGYKPIGYSTTPLTLSKSASLIPIGSNFMCGMDMIYTAKYNIYDNTLLYVVWQEIEIVAENYITYLPNGGEGLAPVDNTNYNDINNMNFTAMRNTFTRENYEFSSWNTKADGSGTTILEDEVRTAFTVFVLGAGKLYAQWTPKATPTPDPTPVEPEKKAHRVLYSMSVAGAYGISVSDSTVYYDGDTVTLITPTPSIIDIGDYTLIFTGYDHADNFIVTSTDSEYIWVTATWLLQPKETAKVWVTYLPGILPNVDNATDEKIDKDESEKATEDTNTTEGNENTESGEGISKGNEMASVVTGSAITVDTTPDKNTESRANSVIIISPESGSYNIGDSITVKESYATGYTNHAYMCPELGRIVAVGEKLVVPAVGLTLIALWTVDGGEVVIPTPTPDPEPTNPPITPTPDPEPTNPPTTPTPDPEPTNPPITPTPTPEPPVVIIPTPDPVPPVVVTPVPITPEEPEPVFGKVYGVIRGIDGKPKAGVMVKLVQSKPRITYSDTEGRYCFDNVEMGNHTLSLKYPRILGVTTVVVYDITIGGKQEIKIDDTVDIVTGAVSLDELQTERQVDFELVKDLVKDTVEEEPNEDDIIKEEDKTKEKEEDTDTDKTPEDKTSKEEDTEKHPTEVEDNGEAKKPTPSVIDPEIVAPEPSIEPEDDPLDLDVTLGLDGTEEPEPTPTPTPEIVDPTPNPTPDKPVPNPIIPIVIAVIGTVTTASVFYFLFIFVLRRKYIYAVIQDIEGNVVDPKRNISKVDKMLARVNLSDIEDILGTLKGVTVTIEQVTANKLAGYKLEIVVKDEIIKTYQFDTEIEADVIVTL